MNPITIDLRPAIRLIHEQFEQIALANHSLKLELTASGELVVMPLPEETLADAMQT